MLTQAAEKLRQGEAVTIRPRGHSMEPLIADGQEVTVAPRTHGWMILPGAIVLATVHGNIYLHKVLAVAGDRVQIGNNKGGVNGWTHISKVWGVML